MAWESGWTEAGIVKPGYVYCVATISARIKLDKGVQNRLAWTSVVAEALGFYPNLFHLLNQTKLNYINYVCFSGNQTKPIKTCLLF